MHLSDLKDLHVTELVDMAITNEIESANRLRKQDLIFALLKNQAKRGESIFGEGTLEVLPDGFGFLRSPRYLLPRRTRRHLCQSLADPQIQPAHGRFDRRRDPDAEGRRALLRAGEGRQGQRRTAREFQAQDPVRKPDPALPHRAVHHGAGHQVRGKPDRPHHRHHRARSARASAACWCPARKAARR